MRVALVSDTHLPAAGPSVPSWVADVLDEADHVLHAGDFLTAQASFQMRVLAGGNVTAVRGNRDPTLDLPEVATFQTEGVRFVLTHGDGIGRGDAYRKALVDLASEYDAHVAVAGHTHHTMDATVDGVRILNPGSATGAEPAEVPTCMTVDCEAGDFSVTLHGV